MAPSSPLASASAAITAPQCCRAVPVAEITQLAAAALNAEVAFVTRNDAGGASVTARFGTCADDIDIVTILAALSERDGVIAIGDAADHPNLRDHRNVRGTPCVAACLNAPILRAPTAAAGTLCVMNLSPRVWSGPEARYSRRKPIGQSRGKWKNAE